MNATTRNHLVTHANKIRFLTFTVICLIIAVVATLNVVIKTNHEVARLAPLAKKYNEICGGVKAALWVDITMLHDTDDPSWMTPEEIEDDRRALFRKVGATIGGDDSYVMMQRCMPHPFPMAAWRACPDDACLRTTLKQAMDSIP